MLVTEITQTLVPPQVVGTVRDLWSGNPDQPCVLRTSLIDLNDPNSFLPTWKGYTREVWVRGAQYWVRLGSSHVSSLCSVLKKELPDTAIWQQWTDVAAWIVERTGEREVDPIDVWTIYVVQDEPAPMAKCSRRQE